MAASGLLAATFGAAQQPGKPPLSAEQQRLRDAKTQSAAAQSRATTLEQAAAAERDEAIKAQQLEAAVAARVQKAEADIAAAQARISIIRRLQIEQQDTLADQQQPIVTLIAALQSLARRPSVLSLVQPGSIDDLVHVRAVLGGALPVVRARTAAVRASLARSRQLQADASVALASLATGRRQLEEERLALTRLEAAHRLKSRELGRSALFESDRAIALGEQARDLVDLMDQLTDAAATRAALEALPGPSPRPPRPGEAPSPVDMANWSSASPPYRLPVRGKLVTGLGELSDTGVRSRGLTLETAPSAQVVTPADGRVLFARPFRAFGTVIILDHGGGWTTLVAGLGRASVAVGDRLVQGSAIGQAPASDRPRVTVELRRRDRPVDLLRLTG
ncbi:MAG: murein hydrolase activator EnvC family protein [Sphingomonas sp.]